MIDLLHKDSLAENREYIFLLLPNRITVLSLPFLMPQFRQRALIAFVFQMVNQSPAGNAFDVAKNIG
jgi:hypothetical protein